MDDVIFISRAIDLIIIVGGSLYVIGTLKSMYDERKEQKRIEAIRRKYMS